MSARFLMNFDKTVLKTDVYPVLLLLQDFVQKKT